MSSLTSPMRRAQSVPTERVTTQTPDGATLVGTFVPPRKLRAPGVLLLHMLGRDRSTYEVLLEPLRAAGFAVLSIDFRGHGESTESQPNQRSGETYVTDANSALRLLAKLRGVNGEHLAIIGASIGANAALHVAVSASAVKRLVLLSPGLTYRGVDTESVAVKVAQTPTLIVTAKKDSYAFTSSQTLSKIIADSQLEVIEGEQHGTDLLSSDPRVTQVLLAHLTPLASGH